MTWPTGDEQLDTHVDELLVVAARARRWLYTTAGCLAATAAMLWAATL